MLERVGKLLRAGHDLDARLLLAAYTTTIAHDHGVRCSLVGRSAVDFYTAATLESVSSLLPGHLRGSVDLDFVTAATRTHGDAVRLRQALADEGFTSVAGEGLGPEGARTWRHPDQPGLLIDVMAGDLEGSMEHVRVLTVDGIDVEVIGPEDLFLQYLEAAMATAHRHDYTRAVALALTHDADIDWQYVQALAPVSVPPPLIEHVRRAGGYEEALEF